LLSSSTDRLTFMQRRHYFALANRSLTPPTTAPTSSSPPSSPHRGSGIGGSLLGSAGGGSGGLGSSSIGLGLGALPQHHSNLKPTSAVAPVQPHGNALVLAAHPRYPMYVATAVACLRDVVWSCQWQWGPCCVLIDGYCVKELGTE
jgi:hypothetical protein